MRRRGVVQFDATARRLHRVHARYYLSDSEGSALLSINEREHKTYERVPKEFSDA